LQRVEAAALRSGRRAEEIKVIAVTKTVDENRILKAVESGLYDLGENRVQELCDKYDKIGNSCRWHLIGHLQTNKVKYIVDRVDLIHSLDRMELAEEMQKRAEKSRQGHGDADSGEHRGRRIQVWNGNGQSFGLPEKR
jgi:Predicted enzyme with a TIM-barrel fold